MGEKKTKNTELLKCSLFESFKKKKGTPLQTFLKVLDNPLEKTNIYLSA